MISTISIFSQQAYGILMVNFTVSVAAYCTQRLSPIQLASRSKVISMSGTVTCRGLRLDSPVPESVMSA